jgi:hypothetical protein
MILIAHPALPYCLKDQLMGKHPKSDSLPYLVIY